MPVELEFILEDEDVLDIQLETDISEVVTSNYPDLQNKPKINNVDLVGDKSFDELGLKGLTNSELEKILI